MTIDKEIRCVALYQFEHDKAKLEQLLELIEETQPQVKIRYARTNYYDPTCMEVFLGLHPIGYVNTDDKRYVEPLLRGVDFCVADFLEVYCEKNHAPMIRFLVTVNLDEVKPLVAGVEWDNWVYTFPVMPMTEVLSTLVCAGDMLRDRLVNNIPGIFPTREELVESFVKASLFDMSVETSERYDDLMFYLETSRERNRMLINTLQHGSTVRRTDRMRDKFLLEWWPKFLMSENAKRLCRKFALSLAQRYGEITEDIINQEYLLLKEELVKLPYALYGKVNNIKAFWGGLYYTKIPRQKFLEVLSAMVLYINLKEHIEKSVPFIVEEQKTTYVQIFKSESKATVINN